MVIYHAELDTERQIGYRGRRYLSRYLLLIIETLEILQIRENSVFKTEF